MGGILIPAFSGLQILESPHVGEQVTPQPPAHLVQRKGPYHRRTIKRWCRLHPPYMRAKGDYFLVGGNQVLCHPDDARRLRERIARLG